MTSQPDYSHSGEEGQAQSDPRAVMVVHGRNEAARQAVFDFLRALGLKPLEWSTLVKGTGKGSPYIGEVLEHAFQQARAVLVLMTPDDEARLRKSLHGKDEPNYETRLTAQARPNVLFEAGMAFGVHPDRTVLVELGALRPFSDVGGRHVVRIDGTEKPLREIASRLETAKCDVDTSGDDWLLTSRFTAALSATVAEPAREPAESVSDQKVEDAVIHDLLDEISTIRLRVERARDAGSYPYNFALPAWTYHEHKAKLPGHLRAVLGTLYVKADDLSQQVEMREGNGSTVAEGDDLDWLLALIASATDELRNYGATFD